MWHLKGDWTHRETYITGLNCPWIIIKHVLTFCRHAVSRACVQYVCTKPDFVS